MNTFQLALKAAIDCFVIPTHEEGSQPMFQMLKGRIDTEPERQPAG